MRTKKMRRKKNEICKHYKYTKYNDGRIVQRRKKLVANSGRVKKRERETDRDRRHTMKINIQG